MSPYNFAILLLSLAPLLWFIHGLITHKKSGHRKPPGPQGFPIIGSLHKLGKLPHLSLYRMAKKYGPIMSIKLGNISGIVVSSPQAAEIFLKSHDLVFASRPKIQAAENMSYGSKGIVFGAYGQYWREVRKFCTLELLSVKKIDSFSGMRREELVLMVDNFRKAAMARQTVDVNDVVGDVIENMVYRMLFGKSADHRFDLRGRMKEIMYQAGAFNIADYIPVLGQFDLQGLTKSIKKTHKSVDKMLEIIISEHEEAASQKKHDTDLLDTLLSNTIERESIKAILIDLIAAGIDTSQTTIEWIITELVRHPRVMKKLQQEIKAVVGDNEIVEDKDLSKLRYLDLVIKENFRLHPTVPLLIPRESMEDIVIDGYYIPKKSRIFVNSWAIGRDPAVWSENALEFFPERFTSKNVDFKGHDFELLAFGSGRRVCPGMNLGLVQVRHIVAQLVHSFDFELPDGMSASDVDMDEKFNLTLPREKHLSVVPSVRI